MILKLFLGPSVRDANPLDTLIGRACRLDNQRYTFLRLQCAGILLKAPHTGAAHISALARSFMLGIFLTRFSARLIIFICKGVFLMDLRLRVKLLSVIKFYLT